MNNALIGQATEEQIKQWKAKHGKVITFIQTDDKGQKHITYARTPRLPEMQNASRFIADDPIKSGLMLLNDCRLGGSEEVIQTDEMKFGVSKKMPSLFQTVEAELGEA